MTESQAAWERFTSHEIEALKPLLNKRGIELHDDQPHISGERFLMSGAKVVLLGTDNNSGANVIIKSSTDTASKQELLHEQKTRTALHSIQFAYNELLTPKELWSEQKNGRLTIVTECIEQPVPFLSLPLVQQFDLLLGAFSMLEGVHATTTSHQTAVSQFGEKTAKNYLSLAEVFLQNILHTEIDLTDQETELLERVTAKICNNSVDIERYCGFLTHDDFALHNFRFQNDAIHLIDQASLTFGNKHESWARILNYMTLYNPDLEQACTKYIQENLSTEEQTSLKLMREFKLLELIAYHAKSVNESVGDIQKLSRARVTFWLSVLTAIAKNTSVSAEVLENYKTTRDALRSDAEIKRQKVLQQLL